MTRTRVEIYLPEWGGRSGSWGGGVCGWGGGTRGVVFVWLFFFLFFSWGDVEFGVWGVLVVGGGLGCVVASGKIWWMLYYGLL